MKISLDEEMIVAGILIDEDLKKQFKRKNYMKEYYRRRKENGFIKTSKKSKRDSFTIIPGPFVINFI